MAPERTFTGKVFIGISVDGFIARPDGSLDWLVPRGEAAGDTGYHDFIAGIDTMVVGRGTFETALGFGEDNWPYTDLRVAVLSTTLPDDADTRVTVFRDEASLAAGLASWGSTDVYVDGGKTIRALLRAGMVQELTITTVPVLIGEGVPLFGPVGGDIPLTLRSTVRLGAGVIQTTYVVDQE
ncbi:dihydrofolate reductase family protein [Spiractinospora alimapuensis]|uniref:dihydrofolate reductase family protein n=1 Tax=Spiractinospora alimapuensis TaxID=2820884 RepID=UPI001F33AEF1|nr:dihydrofolate reductase family protein [Spiractinospora alimapuensis]QVQ51190.1 dihydrofolate reductase family protein [Spiractinospora alimapuensis]